MSSAAVREFIARAAELTDDERSVLVDAIAPKQSVASQASAWEVEIGRRADLVRQGKSSGLPADEVFDRIEAKLLNRT